MKKTFINPTKGRFSIALVANIRQQGECFIKWWMPRSHSLHPSLNQILIICINLMYLHVNYNFAVNCKCNRCRLAKCFVQHNAAIISQVPGGKMLNRTTTWDCWSTLPQNWKQYYHNWLNRRTHNSAASHCSSNHKHTVFFSVVWTDSFLSFSLSLYEKRKKRYNYKEKGNECVCLLGRWERKNFPFLKREPEWDTGWSISRAVSQTHNLCHQSRCVIIARRSESRFQQAGIMKRLHTHTHISHTHFASCWVTFQYCSPLHSNRRYLYLFC